MRHLTVLALLLVGCATQPPAEEAKPEPVAPVVSPPAQRAPRQIMRTIWSFAAEGDECVAVAGSGRTLLQVTVRRNAPIRVVVSLAAPLPSGRRAPVAMRFNGPAGQWQVNAQQASNRQLVAVLGVSEAALSRVLVLLSGGVLELGEQDQALPSLGLAPSEAQGQAWFDCARRNAI
jgi:hypothetical protein